jgi:hypothetical protein
VCLRASECVHPLHRTRGSKRANVPSGGQYSTIERRVLSPSTHSAFVKTRVERQPIATKPKSIVASKRVFRRFNNSQPLAPPRLATRRQNSLRQNPKNVGCQKVLFVMFDRPPDKTRDRLKDNRRAHRRAAVAWAAAIIPAYGTHFFAKSAATPTSSDCPRDSLSLGGMNPPDRSAVRIAAEGVLACRAVRFLLPGVKSI